MKTITFPVSNHIVPGRLEVRFQETIETEIWVMGIYVGEEVEKTDGVFVVDIPMPEKDQLGSITILDRVFTIVREDDEVFWGPGGKRAFVGYTQYKNACATRELAKQFGWDIDDDGNPQPPAIVFSKSELEAEHKTLMAHIMAELKIFPSVGQARKNGWDKPLAVGDYTVTKKKIRFKVVD